MAAVESTMLPLGTHAPAFKLADPNGRLWGPSDFSDAPALLVMFICNHCPFVIHVRSELAALTGEYMDKGVAVIAVQSNDAERYPADAPNKMAEESATHGYRFPYVYDSTQEVAHAYRAACTPDFYLFDAKQSLVYRGQLDDSRPSNGKPVTGADLRAALDSLLSGGPPLSAQTPSIGCNIKWRPGTEPEYFG